MDLFQIMSNANCGGIGPIVAFVKWGLFPIIQIGIPILLIIMGSIDLGKAVLSSDDKEIKGATGRLIKRAIAAVAVFFVTTLVTLLMNMFANTGVKTSDVEGVNWQKCWQEPLTSAEKSAEKAG